MGFPSREEIMKDVSYDPETGVFRSNIDAHNGRWRAGRIVGSPAGRGYYKVTVNGSQRYCHRLAWVYCYGTSPEGEIDHIDGDRSNNAISNLRIANKSQNMWNSKIRKNNSTGLKGVTFIEKRNKYKSRITANGTVIFLGLFQTKYEAHSEYCFAAIKYFGEYARFE